MLGKEYPVDTHFNPPYGPWDQRLCVVPEGDLFKCLKSGSCSIVTGHIDRFTETGIRMKDGSHVEADIIITATGLNIKLVGGARYSVDGAPITFADHVVFKGLMLDDMDSKGMDICVPQRPDREMALRSVGDDLQLYR